MNCVITPSYKEMSAYAANIVREEIQSHPDKVVLGLPTGGTPVGMMSVGKPIGLYERLIGWYAERILTFEHVITFNLDEYMGLPPWHDQSYRWFMDHYLIDHIDIDKCNTRVPNGLSEDADKTCEAYERAIKDAGGIDLLIAGLGSDGHVAFVMPVLDDKDLTLGETQTQIFKLSEVTRADNARFFEGNLNAVPTHAISMGLKTILESRKVLVMAFGQKKAEAVKNAVIGSVTSVVPASYLLRHSDCTFVVDMAAASDLIWEITQQGKGAQLKPASRFGIQAIELEIEQKS